jgi:sugar-specific transcriptional regulator TrmB
MSDNDLVKHLDLVNSVATEYLKGLDASEISRQLDIPRPKVMTLLNDWRAMASNNQAIHARAKEALAGADQHYSSLIKKAYEVIDVADTNTNLGAKTQAIKLIADIESKRLEMLQKAGLLDNKEIAEQIIEMERKQDVLMKILKEVASKHPEVREEIMRRLSEIQTEVVVIDND